MPIFFCHYYKAPVCIIRSRPAFNPGALCDGLNAHNDIVSVFRGRWCTLELRSLNTSLKMLLRYFGISLFIFFFFFNWSVLLSLLIFLIAVTYFLKKFRLIAFEERLFQLFFTQRKPLFTFYIAWWSFQTFKSFKRSHIFHWI